MSLNNKVVWSEGMFLNPQHFQQQERYIESLVNGKCAALGAYAWGFHDFSVDQELLKLGKLSVVNARGVFPDGTPFNFPNQDEPPPVLEVPPGTHDAVVYLALPVRRPGAVDVLAKDDAQGLARYYLSKVESRDVTVDGGDTLSIDVGKLRLRLLLETDDRSGYACVGVTRITECREDKNVLLDDQYIPTCLDCSASSRLTGYISEMIGLLHHRGESIAGRLADTQRGGTAEIADYMLLQLVNRLEPLANHLNRVQGLHPLELFGESVQMVGELSTFATKTKRPANFPPYLHDNLQATFAPVITSLRQCLTMVGEQTAIAMPLVEKRFGIRVAQIPDRTLLTTAIFVLAVRADIPENTLRTHLPAQIKIGTVEHIRQLVNLGVQGIPIKALPVAPRQIPFRAGYTYFELERNTPLWKELRTTGGFAVHVGGDFPGIEFEFWAIRQ
jgi:type VI secretion system protein ImpJ